MEKKYLQRFPDWRKMAKMLGAQKGRKEYIGSGALVV